MSILYTIDLITTWIIFYYSNILPLSKDNNVYLLLFFIYSFYCYILYSLRVVQNNNILGKKEEQNIETTIPIWLIIAKGRDRCFIIINIKLIMYYF